MSTNTNTRTNYYERTKSNQARSASQTRGSQSSNYRGSQRGNQSAQSHSQGTRPREHYTAEERARMAEALYRQSREYESSQARSAAATQGRSYGGGGQSRNASGIQSRGTSQTRAAQSRGLGGQTRSAAATQSKSLGSTAQTRSGGATQSRGTSQAHTAQSGSLGGQTRGAAATQSRGSGATGSRGYGSTQNRAVQARSYGGSQSRSGSQTQTRGGINTRDYIEGNTVREIEEMPAEHKPAPQPKTLKEIKAEKAKKLAARRNMQRALAMNKGYVAFLTAATAVCLVVCFAFVALQSDISARMSAISTAETSLSDMKDANSILENQLETGMTLGEVKDRADELGLVYPDDSQIEYYSVDSSDYMNQYSDVASR